MFPPDSITYHSELSGPVTDYFFTDPPATLLGISFQQSANNSTTELRCGNDTVALNYAKDLSFNPLNYVCDQSLNLTKTGNDNSSVIVTYVPYDRSLYPDGYNPSAVISTSSEIYPVGIITAGDLAISLFIFLFIVLFLATNIAKGLSKIKTSKKFLQYHGGDVEIRNDL